MKKVLVLAALAALVIPATALAGKPPAKPAPQVQYILQGKLSAYDPFWNSVTIFVTGSNERASVLTGQALTFSLDSNTKLSLGGLPTISDFDNGQIKVTAPKDLAPGSLDEVLQNTAPNQVVDLGP